MCMQLPPHPASRVRGRGTAQLGWPPQPAPPALRGEPTAAVQARWQTWQARSSALSLSAYRIGMEKLYLIATTPVVLFFFFWFNITACFITSWPKLAACATGTGS